MTLLVREADFANQFLTIVQGAFPSRVMQLTFTVRQVDRASIRACWTPET
jgi:hypothetical protein